MKMYDKKIETPKDVADFFQYLLKEHNLNFHPDDDFQVYVNCETDRRTFCDDDANIYNDLMLDCFKVCEKYSTDIYGIAIKQARDIYNQRIGKAESTKAALIAAAPDLLEACKMASKIIIIARKYFPKSIKNSDTFDLENTNVTLSKAIHKAEQS